MQEQNHMSKLCLLFVGFIWAQFYQGSWNLLIPKWNKWGLKNKFKKCYMIII